MKVISVLLTWVNAPFDKEVDYPQLIKDMYFDCYLPCAFCSAAALVNLKIPTFFRAFWASDTLFNQPKERDVWQ